MFAMPCDEDVFARAYRMHYAAVARFLGGFSLGSFDAEDIAQETFLRLARDGGEVPEERVRFWLFRVARNLALNELRRGRTWSAVRSLMHRAFAGDPESAIAARQEAHALLGALSEESRAMVILRDVEGMSYAEIAATLEVSPAKVKTDLFRARSRMREELRRKR
jgi:RNA polymerase sigma factor (sigma-70 family)